MKNVSTGLFALACLFLSSCHRPVALFQPSPRPAATRLAVQQATADQSVSSSDSVISTNQPVNALPMPVSPPVATRSHGPVSETGGRRVQSRMHRIQSLLTAKPAAQTPDQQPQPKPKKKLKLGNQIRQGLGMKLRPELNWWQRISWKLKASVFIILVAIVFAILNITILAIIFGIVGAFLLISGLKKSFKVKRPWF